VDYPYDSTVNPESAMDNGYDPTGYWSQTYSPAATGSTVYDLNWIRPPTQPDVIKGS